MGCHMSSMSFQLLLLQLLLCGVFSAAAAAVASPLSSVGCAQLAASNADCSSGGVIELLGVQAVATDLTHAVGSDTIVWPTSERFNHEYTYYGMVHPEEAPSDSNNNNNNNNNNKRPSDHAKQALWSTTKESREHGFFYSMARFSQAEHGATHLDAPIHFSAGGATVGQLPLSSLMARAVVIDVSAPAQLDPNYQVSVVDLQRWEEAHNSLIPAQSIVLIRTDWSKRWPNEQCYLGTEKRGAEGVKELSFPGLHPAAAAFLAIDRKIAAVGIDTASIDHGQSAHYLSHQLLLSRGIPVFENVRCLASLPAWGSWAIGLPMKLSNGTGAPLRLVGLVPHPASPSSTQPQHLKTQSGGGGFGAVEVVLLVACLALAAYYTGYLRFR